VLTLRGLLRVVVVGVRPERASLRPAVVGCLALRPERVDLVVASLVEVRRVVDDGRREMRLVLLLFGVRASEDGVLVVRVIESLRLEYRPVLVRVRSVERGGVTVLGAR